MGGDFVRDDPAITYRVFTHQPAPAFTTPVALRKWFKDGTGAVKMGDNKHKVDWLLDEDYSLYKDLKEA